MKRMAKKRIVTAADRRKDEYLKDLMKKIKKSPKAMKICVLGAGHGGLAMAGHLAIMGFVVNLYSRSKSRIQPVTDRKGIRVEGAVHGFGEIRMATNDIKKAIEDVDILMVAVPANAHRFIAQTCAPFLKENQIVVLNPGRTGGALEFFHILRAKGAKIPFIAEAQVFIYDSRALGPAHVEIFSIKDSIPMATLPAHWIPKVLEVIEKAFPQFITADNIFKTSFDNIGSVFHPTLSVLNAAWIEETHGDFEYYTQGASKSVAEVLEKIDKERMDVAGALGIKAMSAKTWLYTAYSATGKDLHEAMQDNPGYRDIKAPDRLHHRYIDEDVPMSLVPIASIGAMLKVETPTINSIIHLASLMRKKDFWKEGRTVKKMGIEGLPIREIRLLAVT